MSQRRYYYKEDDDVPPRPTPKFDTALSRIIMWIAQALLCCFMIWVWSENKEIKGQLAAQQAAQMVRTESFVRLEGKAERYGQDIAEIRSSIQSLIISVNEMRLSQERLRSK